MTGTTPPPSEFAPGSRFAGKFLIEKMLGQGGMGAVYQALHEGLRQRFAIKVLLGEVAQNAEAVQRFMNEASASASIQSEHVARVTDVSRTESGTAYMVMEYLEGKDLSQLLEDRGRIPTGEAVSYALQAIEGVHQAHVAKIVHRDLKPSNLFLAKKADGTQIIKVLDFGISKMTGLDAQAAALTTTRAMLGSPLYMSPEQLRNSKTVDARSDVWSLGVILYELLSGSVPYVGESLGELFACILENDPIPLRQHEPSIPPALEAAVMQCLRKKKEERIGSVAELAQLIAPFANQPSQLAANVTRGLVHPASFHSGVEASSLRAPYPSSSGAYGPPPSQHVSSGSLAVGAQQPMAQTGSGPNSWATGSMNKPPPAKAPVGLLVGLGGGALLLGAIALFVVLRGNAAKDPNLASADPPPVASVVTSAAGHEGVPPTTVTAANTPPAASVAPVPEPAGSGSVGGTVAAANPPVVKTEKVTGKKPDKTPPSSAKLPAATPPPAKPPTKPEGLGMPDNR